MFLIVKGNNIFRAFFVYLLPVCRIKLVIDLFEVIDFSHLIFSNQYNLISVLETKIDNQINFKKQKTFV